MYCLRCLDDSFSFSSPDVGELKQMARDRDREKTPIVWDRVAGQGGFVATDARGYQVYEIVVLVVGINP
jgi:translation initiation factor IF-2